MRDNTSSLQTAKKGQPDDFAPPATSDAEAIAYATLGSFARGSFYAFTGGVGHLTAICQHVSSWQSRLFCEELCVGGYAVGRKHGDTEELANHSITVHSATVMQSPTPLFNDFDYSAVEDGPCISTTPQPGSGRLPHGRHLPLSIIDDLDNVQNHGQLQIGVQPLMQPPVTSQSQVREGLDRGGHIPMTNTSNATATELAGQCSTLTSIHNHRSHSSSMVSEAQDVAFAAPIPDELIDPLPLAIDGDGVVTAQSSTRQACQECIDNAQE